MTKPFPQALILSLTVIFLSGCLPKNVTEKVTVIERPVPGGEPTAGSAPNRTINPSGNPGSLAGTMDLGGGNGINNRVLEQYSVELSRDLPVFQQEVLPILRELDRLLEGEGSNSNTGSKAFELFHASKQWYFIPDEAFDQLFPRIQNQVLGFQREGASTQQLAIQTDRSVWVKKDTFEKKSKADQVALLMHEIIMTAYFFKFKSIEEMCRLGERIFTSRGNQQHQSENLLCDNPFWRVVQYQNPTQPLRALNPHDYENIRTVTARLLQALNQKFNSGIEFRRFMLSFEFDRRIFQSSWGGPVERDQTQEAKISMRELQEIVQAFNLSSTRKNCFLHGSENPVACAVRMKIESADHSYRLNLPDNVPPQFITLKTYFLKIESVVHGARAEALLYLKQRRSDQTEAQFFDEKDIHLAPSGSIQGRQAFMLSAPTAFIGEAPKVGDTFWSTQIYLTRSHPGVIPSSPGGTSRAFPLRVLEFSMVPLAITQVQPSTQGQFFPTLNLSAEWIRDSEMAPTFAVNQRGRLQTPTAIGIAVGVIEDTFLSFLNYLSGQDIPVFHFAGSPIATQ